MLNCKYCFNQQLLGNLKLFFIPHSTYQCKKCDKVNKAPPEAIIFYFPIPLAALTDYFLVNLKLLKIFIFILGLIISFLLFYFYSKIKSTD